MSIENVPISFCVDTITFPEHLIIELTPFTPSDTVLHKSTLSPHQQRFPFLLNALCVLKVMYARSLVGKTRYRVSQQWRDRARRKRTQWWSLYKRQHWASVSPVPPRWWQNVFDGVIKNTVSAQQWDFTGTADGQDGTTGRTGITFHVNLFWWEPIQISVIFQITGREVVCYFRKTVSWCDEEDFIRWDTVENL